MAAREDHQVSGSMGGSASPASYPSGTSSDAIRADIERTRAEMDETVERLEQRVRPRHLLDDLLDYFGPGQDTGAGEAAGKAKDFASRASQTLMSKLRRHPLSAALIGAGLTWMLVDEATDKDLEPRWTGRRIGGHGPHGKWRDEDLDEYSGSYVDARTGEPYDRETYGEGYRRTEGTTGGTSDTAGAAATGGAGVNQVAFPGSETTAGAGATGEQASQGPGLTDKVRDKAGQVGGAISGAAAGARDGTARYARSAMRGARTAQERVGDGVSRGARATRDTVMSTAHDYPLAVGAAALALGVVAGLILPGSRREDELMGEQSDRLKRQAKDLGQSAVEHGKQVASATASAVTDEARKQGLDVASIADKVSSVAHDVKESAKREGLDPGSVGQSIKAVAGRAKETAKDEARQHKDELKSDASRKTS